MTEENPPAEKRRRTVPIKPWWAAAVRRELGKRDQKWLAEQVGASQSEVSKVLTAPNHEHHKPVLEIIVAISDLLKLPYPFFIPETESIAVELAKQHRLLKRDVQLDEITAGVAETTGQSQTADLVSEHGSRYSPGSSKQRAKQSPRKRSESRT